MTEALVLGLVQGLTEYLPISSSAHLILVPRLMGWEYPGLAFNAVLHLGTLLAILIYFRTDLYGLVSGAFDPKALPEVRGECRTTLSAIAAATVPVGVLGLLFKDRIEALSDPIMIISFSLILFALILALAEKTGSRTRGLSGLGFWEIQVIGLAQALALVPGASRSGVTLTAALFLGLRRDEAARFAFLVGIPAIAAAGLMKLRDLVAAGIAADDALQLAVGVAVSFVSGLAAIEFMIRFLRTRSTWIFIVYRVCLGLAMLLLVGL